MLKEYRELMQSRTALEIKAVAKTHNPVFVGGVGGSGTRLISTLAQNMGCSIGSNNREPSLDNLFWPPMQKLLIAPVARTSSRQAILSHAFSILESKMNASPDFQANGKRPWVSKNPECYVFLEDLLEFFPKMKYIHLIRHGLDMAFSDNKYTINQWDFYFGIFRRRNFGKKSEGKGNIHVHMLEYWIRANRHVLAIGQNMPSDRFLQLSFDELCLNPQPNIQKLADFLGIEPESVNIPELAKLIKAPSSIGRYKEHDYRSIFSEEQLAAVKSLGLNYD